MNGRFKIFLRHRQLRYTFPNTTNEVDVVVQCDSVTNIAEYVPGTVDNNWYDYTNFIEGAEKISLTWDKVNSGASNNSQTNKDGSNYDKGISSDLTFFGDAFNFIYDWLLKNECQIVNAVEVRIIDLIAGKALRIFEIKSDNIEYAPIDEPCQFSIKLREQDYAWHCIHKTLIFDDWQGWFQKGNKNHPCFLTCIEPRPRLINSARMALMLFYHSNPIINIFDSGDEVTDTRRILNANRFVDSPLIRTYIENVAGKCGLTFDTIFDEGQPFENLCLFYPQAGYMHEDDESDISPALFWHYDNRWLVTIAELFDKLKTVFASEWYVTPNNKIIFKPIKQLISLDPIYDFTAKGAAPIYDLRYTFNGDKKPAYGRYEYAPDGSDLASQEIANLYNDIVDYDGTANNPMLEGDKTKNFEFAATGFVRDGRSKDYMELLIRDGRIGALILTGIVSVVTGALLAGILSAVAAGVLGAALAVWLITIPIKTNKLLDTFVNDPVYTGSVRLTAEQTLQPRLLLWDGATESRAKVVQTISLPQPNTYYNPDSTAYDIKNRIDQNNPSKTVYNYPMYFDSEYLDNLFDNYHDDIDNPLKSLETHQNAKWNVDLCEDMLNLFGVFENQYAVIGKLVKLEKRNGYDVFVRIGNINPDYGDMKINIRGTVIRRRNVPESTECVNFEINADCIIINGSLFDINVN